MALPKTIKIGAHEIEVIYPYDMTGEEDGVSCWNTQRISISSELNETSATITLFHEILEYMNTMYQNFLFGDNEEKEQRINMISELLFSLIKDNG